MSSIWHFVGIVWAYTSWLSAIGCFSADCSFLVDSLLATIYNVGIKLLMS